MRVITTGRCSNCGTILDGYSTKPLQSYAPQYFGARVLKCPKCKALYVNERAVELATLSEKSIYYYRKEYATNRNIGVSAIVSVLCLWLASAIFSEAWVNRGINGGIVLLLGFGIAYGIQFLFKYNVLFDEYLKQSEERMADPEYVEQIKTYNKIKFGKEDWKN